MTQVQERSSNSFFELNIDPGSGRWNLISADAWLRIMDVGVLCVWRQGTTIRVSNTLEGARPDDPGEPSDAIGSRLLMCHLRSTNDNEIGFYTEFTLSETEPFCFIRLRVDNQSMLPINLERVDFMSRGRKSGYQFASRRTTSMGDFAVDADFLSFLGQGWQSWSYAGVLRNDDHFPRTLLGPFTDPMHLCWGDKHPKRAGHLISDFYGAVFDHQSGVGLLLGFLSQKQAFGRVEVDLSSPGHVSALWQNLEGICLPPGKSFTTDWACIYRMDLQQADPMGPYLDQVALINGGDNIKDPLSGWCSWYCFGQDISGKVLQDQLDWIVQNRQRLPFELFQIDDGYQHNIGDWEQDTKRFPEPLMNLAGELQGASLSAGIWMAPLIALPGSSLARKHPEWMLRDKHNRLVNAGFGWGRFFRALDGTQPGVKHAIQDWVNRAIKEWGFEYLKLDFLYAGALVGARHDDEKTGAKVLRDVLGMIRDVAGEETFLVGCGCPIGSGIGLVDSMRIGPDVSEHWRGKYKGISLLFDRDPGFPSAWNAIRNTYYRAHVHDRWWLNDPDCLILRDQTSDLNEDEIRTLATMISLSGGVIIDSDPLSLLSNERVDWLSRLIPPINKRPLQPTLFNRDLPPLLVHKMRGAIADWTLAAVFNFSDWVQDLKIDSTLLGFDAGDLIRSFDFWDHHIKHYSGTEWALGVIPAHGVRLFALRRVSGQADWLGDTIHISQGLPISTWDIRSNGLTVSINAGRKGWERIWLSVPSSIKSAIIDGIPVGVSRVEEGVITIGIQLKDKNTLDIEWD